MSARNNNFLLIFGIANLVAASFFVLCIIVPDSWCYGPTNPNPPPPNPRGPMTQREMIAAAVAFVWFASALGLFFRSRIGWLGSLVGVGLMNIVCAKFAAGVFGELLSLDVPDTYNGRHLIARLVIEGFIDLLFFGMVGLVLVFSVGLFLGLLKMRKEVRWI